MATTGLPATSYRFPIDEPSYAKVIAACAKEDAKWLLEMVRAASMFENVGGGLFDYAVMGPAFCAASVLLNAMKVYPPRIRQTRKVDPLPKGVKPSAEQSRLSNDRQVIDLHWLYCTEQGVPEPRWSNLRSGKTFDFKMAAEFVRRVGTTANKATALSLTPAVEMQLAAIQTRPSADKWRGILDGARKTTAKAEEARAGTTSRLSAETAALLPDAYVAFRVAGPSPEAAARSLFLFSGRTASADKMRSCRDWLVKARLMTA